MLCGSDFNLTVNSTHEARAGRTGLARGREVGSWWRHCFERNASLFWRAGSFVARFLASLASRPAQGGAKSPLLSPAHFFEDRLNGGYSACVHGTPFSRLHARARPRYLYRVPQGSMGPHSFSPAHLFEDTLRERIHSASGLHVRAFQS